MKVPDVTRIWFQILGPQTEKARFPNWVQTRGERRYQPRFFHVRRKQWSTNKKMALIFDPWPWNSGCRGTCSCKISSSWVQRFMNYRVNKHFALSRNGKTLENPVLWPWPLTNVLKFSGFRAVVIIHAHRKFHLATCSSSWVIVCTEKKNSDENNTVGGYSGQ